MEDLCENYPLRARHVIRAMLEDETIQGALIHENSAHWTALVKQNRRLWHVDSCAENPRLLDEATFSALIQQHPASVLCLEHIPQTHAH